MKHTRHELPSPQYIDIVYTSGQRACRCCIHQRQRACRCCLRCGCDLALNGRILVQYVRVYSNDRPLPTVLSYIHSKRGSLKREPMDTLTKLRSLACSTDMGRRRTRLQKRLQKRVESEKDEANYQLQCNL